MSLLRNHPVWHRRVAEERRRKQLVEKQVFRAFFIMVFALLFAITMGPIVNRLLS